MRFKIIVFILICAFASSGCVVTKIHTRPVQNYSAPYDEVWNDILIYLNRDNEPIILTDKEKGLISTDWVIMEKVFGAKRYCYNIEINKLGENAVSVTVVSPQEEYSMGDWEDMLPTERRAQRIFDYLKAEIKNPYKGTGQTTFGKIEKRPYNKRQR